MCFKSKSDALLELELFHESEVVDDPFGISIAEGFARSGLSSITPRISPNLSLVGNIRVGCGNANATFWFLHIRFG